MGRLYDAHGAALYRYALMLLADHGAAEDAIQQVFATILRGSGTIDNEAHYLRRAVRNECFSALRRRQADRADERPLLEPVAPEGASADERMLIECALKTLPPDQREVIHLHVFEGMTFQEVADAAGESINTITSRYRYGLSKLRTAIVNADAK